MLPLAIPPNFSVNFHFPDQILFNCQIVQVEVACCMGYRVPRKFVTKYYFMIYLVILYLILG